MKRNIKIRNKDFIQYKENSELYNQDYLTGLPNRHALYDYYENLDKEKQVHIMFIDVDNFKTVNDTYGHSEGDKLLKCIGGLLRDKLGEGNIFRIGGDEFVAITTNLITELEIVAKIQDLMNVLKQADFRKDVLSLVSFSIGIVMNQNVNQILDEVLNKCDSAMYQAKADGKSSYVIYHSMEKMIESHKNIEAEMEGALLRGEFQAFIQPKVNMLNSKLFGAEALARWIHPIEGIRSPAQFIPLFEKNGFITKLDMYIYEEVCKMKHSWKGTRLEHTSISFNMSRLHLYHRDFPNRLKRIADKYQINPRELEVEITESTFFKDSQELIYMVGKLKGLGFVISIDDFGSGYSALNMLKDIPAEIIKIDKEFLQLSSNTYKGKKVIRNIIIMCKELKLEVIAEGIETKAQADFVTSCGCEIAQGYYYAKPMPKHEFVEFANTLLSDEVLPIIFSFNGTFESTDGKLKAEYIYGDGKKTYEFVPGVIKGRQAIRLPGGNMEEDCVSIPERVMYGESFTIALWAKTSKVNAWTSILYVKYETGFVAIVPNAWEGHSTYRIRDSRNVDGWHDTPACQFPDNKWMHIAITYNAKTDTTAFYYDGQLLGTEDEIPTQRLAKRILLGGDVFQQSYCGTICDVMFYSEVKSPEEINELYVSYIKNPDINI